ncbi:flagellin [Clostridium beijerinckii]|uniref:flagellin N-terminal helical domain-containing protein n=1 Tax=Clostridium beijerinckii TaxID=1520 RepID=UPI001361CF21|nr:flagellin [Clostridium beijerinckii]MZK49862.1 VWA domain-containing protein [Clostridium beijerinckii]MZK57821.1 VWA domain-containing protein [Clostridium beijerinckii]MZK68032.1 VWA domain-containing protein [Clostridium beijerinckii]MZK73529.1 VWA domain-containing protein [Clostridium beijerinckii]MZK83112.1 VWA domain-containing protein [Clostridium beijerinckii]
MIINHNVDAIIASNRSNRAGKTKANAMEKLSSGLRINQAADDAAGSAISQKMRAQIRGLEQADRNIQDGISLVQTAEAGLGSIQNPNLSRMRDLIVQALNGTLTQADRMNIQNELDNVKASINDIANNTEFNTIKVLCPPNSGNSTPPKWTPGTADIVFVIDITGSMGSKINEVKNNIDGFINKITENGIDVNMGLVTYGDVNLNQGGDPVVKTTMTSNLEEFKSYINSISLTGGGDYYESGLEGIADAANGALSYSFRADSAKQIILVTDAPVHDNNTDSDGGDGLSNFDIDDVAANVKSNGIKLTVVSTEEVDTKTQFERLYGTTGGEYINIISNFQEQLNSYASKILIDAGCKEEIKASKMPTLQLQVGANSGEQFEVELFDARTKNLGIDDIVIDPVDEAEKALEKVDKAMEVVSKQRSKFGAYQNALEHIGNNVGNYSYNITSAESRISDADMAKEAMEMSKSSIIEQSAEAMEKQSENMSQSIIDLMSKWKG